MEDCINLQTCPKCKGIPQLMIAEMDLMLSLVCSTCSNEYNSAMNPGSLGTPITEEMYRKVCYEWNYGVSVDKSEDFILPKYA